jgi:FAD/FMN-containing dehydrogenase
VIWAKVIAAAAPHGLAPLVGSTPDVSAVGYLTGGGLPVLGRRYGFAADQVRGLELVTADGRLRDVTPRSHSDLFWAVRGGKGNFGIVTSIDVDLLPLERLYGGGLFFPGDATAEVLRGWLAWTASLPDDMCSSLALARFPDTSPIPEAMRGQFTIHIRIAFTGSAADGEQLLRPLRALGPVADTVADMPSSRIGEVHSDPIEPVPVRDRGILLRRLDDDAIDRVVAMAGPQAKLPPGMVEIRHLGGALARPPQTPHAIGQREAEFTFILGMVAMPGQTGQVDALQQRLIDGMAPWDTGGALPNFLSSTETAPHEVRAAYRAADYERLAAIKAVYDPHNVFRVNHNIPPAR